MSFNIIEGNLLDSKAQAIVNAANSRLDPGGGVCGAIFQAAGYDQLNRECQEIGGCATGSAVATDAYNLPAKKIIHAVGPIWSGGKNGEEQLLRSAYKTAVELAKNLNLDSIAFPLISSGIYGYPKEKALNVAMDELSELGKVYPEMDIELYLYK